MHLLLACAGTDTQLIAYVTLKAMAPGKDSTLPMNAPPPPPPLPLFPGMHLPLACADTYTVGVII